MKFLVSPASAAASLALGQIPLLSTIEGNLAKEFVKVVMGAQNVPKALGSLASETIKQPLLLSGALAKTLIPLPGTEKVINEINNVVDRVVIHSIQKPIERIIDQGIAKPTEAVANFLNPKRLGLWR